MAIEFMRFSSIGSRSARLADYIQRSGEYAKKEDDFVCGGFSGLPSWAATPHDFFLEAEKQEKGEIGKHVIIALPKELNFDENKELAEETIKSLFPSHTYVWGIHQNEGVISGEKNPHLHILVCDRKIEKEREEPPKEIYFKKSRTLKNGEISGGYRKDPLLNGHEMRKGLLLKKLKLQEIVNKHIDRHNEKTGEEVRKIDFTERHGKGMPHMGKKAVSIALKTHGIVMHSEINRRLEILAKIEAEKVLKIERQTIQKTIKLPLLDRFANAAISFIKNPTNSEKRAKFLDNKETAQKYQKMTLTQRNQLAWNTEENAKIAKNNVVKKADEFSAILQKEAAKRGIAAKIDYSAGKTTVENLEKIAEKAEKRRELIAEKIQSKEFSINAEWSEGKTVEIVMNSPKIEEKPKKMEKQEKNDFLKEVSERRRCDGEVSIEKTPPTEKKTQIEENRINTPKINTKAKKNKRDRGFSR